MPRVKLTFAALVALLGIFALSGCQQQPNLAATVGDMSITNDEVDATVAKIQSSIEATGQEFPPNLVGTIRQRVVLFTVFNELARRYTKEKSISVPTPDYAGAAQSAGLPEDNPYARLLADTLNYRDVLIASAKPATPSEADLQAVYTRYAAQSGESAVDYATAKPSLAADPDVQLGVGLSNDLQAAAKRYGLSVNPRYAPLELPLTTLGGNGQLVLVTLPLGGQGGGVVRDLV